MIVGIHMLRRTAFRARRVQRFVRCKSSATPTPAIATQTPTQPQQIAIAGDVPSASYDGYGADLGKATQQLLDVGRPASLDELLVPQFWTGQPAIAPERYEIDCAGLDVRREVAVENSKLAQVGSFGGHVLVFVGSGAAGRIVGDVTPGRAATATAVPH